VADYIKKNILSQAYVHVEPTAFETEEDLESFKTNLTQFTKSRVEFFLSPELPVEIEFEDGSLIARVTVMGTIGLLLTGISNYKNFREGIQLIYSDSKRLTEYIISETTFQSGARQQNVIRLEARVGIIGSIQKVINQLESIKRGANGSMMASDVSKKIDEASKELRKLFQNINDENDKELVRAGLESIAEEIPDTPKAPKDKVNSEQAILLFSRKRKAIQSWLAASTVNKNLKADS
jgi:hypothetical protein